MRACSSVPAAHIRGAAATWSAGSAGSMPMQACCPSTWWAPLEPPPAVPWTPLERWVSLPRSTRSGEPALPTTACTLSYHHGLLSGNSSLLSSVVLQSLMRHPGPAEPLPSALAMISVSRSSGMMSATRCCRALDVVAWNLMKAAGPVM